MDRKQALEHQGGYVIADTGGAARYIGKLLEVETPPRKTWQGRVEILGVHSLHDIVSLQELTYQGKDEVTLSGAKISPADEQSIDANRSFQNSFYDALGDYRVLIASELENTEARLQQIDHELYPGQPAKQAKTETDEAYVYYQLGTLHQKPALIDNDSGEPMDLEGCPFELEVLQNDNEWLRVYHQSGYKFQAEDGSLVEPAKGDTLRIHRRHFDPYQILLNELEVPARQTLSNALGSFGFTEEDLTTCHNQLLHQLLASSNEDRFSGVNFLMYQKQGTTLLVQHQYERELKNTEDDIVFDRFECTTDKNKRSIVTYTNQFAAGK
ncbi:uncharacterized protein DUF2777 [Salsuginibacillus halophilus]|uniref:Uncharacterized protein DUF2777 n=1 Tax=Salsuginibacillus halophilus TaxID=517424 RepID=A0A2P8HWE7_9BACI|nr:DUF2777 family protein [Salsuginibacillus halophilus]PSL50562.1 uncharacterized protein DUF2777 [Salsuginibacillus halophilus]